MNEKLREFFIMSEQDYAECQLKILAENKSGKPTKETEQDFMYSSGAYDACKNIAKIMKIKYSFCL